MPEWWTYSLSDFLMFSGRTWYRLLELHNTVWLPLQLVTTLAASWLLWAARSGGAGPARAALVVAGLGWVFAGWAFHWVRYSSINWGAAYFAIAFGVQGLLLVWLGCIGRGNRPSPDMASRLGQALLLAALLYPLLALASGRSLAQTEWVALMPDPTALATLGLLLCLRDAVWPLLIPLLWCVVAGATLWTLNAPEWFLLPLAGTLTLALALWRKAAAHSLR